jgi:hypothetical protein
VKLRRLGGQFMPPVAERAAIQPVREQQAGLRLLQPCQQRRHGRFAAARRPLQQDPPAALSICLHRKFTGFDISNSPAVIFDKN